MSAARLVKSTPRLLNAVADPGASEARSPVFSVLLSIGRPSMIISGWLLLLIELTPRIVIDDDAPGTPDVLVTVDAGDASLQRVDEVLALGPGDVGARHGLLRRAELALRRGLAERRRRRPRRAIVATRAAGR